VTTGAHHECRTQYPFPSQTELLARRNGNNFLEDIFIAEITIRHEAENPMAILDSHTPAFQGAEKNGIHYYYY